MTSKKIEMYAGMDSAEFARKLRSLSPEDREVALRIASRADKWDILHFLSGIPELRELTDDECRLAELKFMMSVERIRLALDLPQDASSDKRAVLEYIANVGFIESRLKELPKDEVREFFDRVPAIPNCLLHQAALLKLLRQLAAEGAVKRRESVHEFVSDEYVVLWSIPDRGGKHPHGGVADPPRKRDSGGDYATVENGSLRK